MPAPSILDLPLAFWAVAMGLFGTATGSFVNVVAHRVPLGRSLMGRSHCPACGHTIGPIEILPVVGWVILRGRCRACKGPIAWRYPAVELLTGLTWATATWFIGMRWELPAHLWFVSMTTALILTDLDTHRLPNRVVYPGTVVGTALLVGGALASGTADRLGWALLGGIVYFSFMLLLALAVPGGFGFGDVKLSFLLGLFVAFQVTEPLVGPGLALGSVGVAIFGAFFLGGLVAIGLLIARRRGRKDQLAFGPAMILASWVATLWGSDLLRAYLG